MRNGESIWMEGCMDLIGCNGERAWPGITAGVRSWVGNRGQNPLDTAIH